MKTRLVWLASAWLGALAWAGAAGTAEVTWKEDGFAYRDIEVQGLDPQGSLEVVQDAFNPMFARFATDYLAEGEILRVSVEDLDLAGELEPWRSRWGDDIRVIRTIYPPSMRFSWQIVTADGTVRREGTERLRDDTFEWKIRPGSRRLFDIEEEMLRDWARRTLRESR